MVGFSRKIKIHNEREKLEREFNKTKIELMQHMELI